MPSAQDVLFNALIDNQVLGLDQTAIPPEMTAACLSKFNRRLGQWNALGSLGSYEYTQVFTLPTSANSYTIGAAGDSPALSVTSGRAPARIDSAKRVTADGYETEIAVLAFPEWNMLTKPDQSSTLPEAVYLQGIPKLPKLWVYPVPASGQKLRLSWRVLLNTVLLADIATSIDFSEGVEDALTWTLAEDLCIPFGRTISDDLRRMATAARMAMLSLFNVPPVAYPDCMSEGGGSATLATFLSRDI